MPTWLLLAWITTSEAALLSNAIFGGRDHPTTISQQSQSCQTVRPLAQPMCPHYKRVRGGFATNSAAADGPAPFAVVVTVEIDPSRVEEFLEVMKIDVAGSRTEDGCLRFDLLRDEDHSNVFTFYEVYVDKEALATHKTMPHYKVWTDFKDSGGVLSQRASKCMALDYTC